MGDNVQEFDLEKMFKRAIEDVEKASDLLKSNMSKAEASKRFFKLSKRFYDVYKVFFDTFGESMNIVAAKALLHFTRSCMIIAQTLVSTDWLQVQENMSSVRRFMTAPKRAARKVYKRKLRPEQFKFTNDDEDYNRMFKSEAVKKKDHVQLLVNIAAGLKEISMNLIYVFDNSHLIENPEIKATKVNTKVEEFNLDIALDDLKQTKVIVFAYYKAITDIDDQGEVNVFDVLSPLMEKFGIANREKIVSEVDEPATRPFAELTDSKSELKKVSTYLHILGNGEGKI